MNVKKFSRKAKRKGPNFMIPTEVYKTILTIWKNIQMCFFDDIANYLTRTCFGLLGKRENCSLRRK